VTEPVDWNARRYAKQICESHAAGDRNPWPNDIVVDVAAAFLARDALVGEIAELLEQSHSPYASNGASDYWYQARHALITRAKETRGE
jgi:hypothetical protein